MAKDSIPKFEDTHALPKQKEDDVPHFDDTHPVEESHFEAPPVPGMGETILDQGLQGATAGFSDELAGLGAGAAQLVTGDHGPKQGRDWEALKQAYTQMRDQQRHKLAAQQEAHPYASLGSQIVGGIPTAIATGGSGLAAVGLGAATGLGSSDADLTTGEGAMKAAGSTALGGALGGAGVLAGKALSKALNPAEMETLASKAAQDVVGLRPQKDIPIKFDAESGRALKQYGQTKGYGTAALESKSLPATGGMEGIASKTQDAITRDFDQLKPLIAETQKKIEANPALQQAIQEQKPLDKAVSSYLEDFFNNLPETSRTPEMRKKLLEFYQPRIERIVSKEGNLPEIIAEKKKLYEDSRSLARNVFKSPDSLATENEATFLKGLGLTLKDHSETLALAADKEAGAQVKQLNTNIHKLITFQEAAEKQIGKKPSSTFDKLISWPTKFATGFNPDQLAEIGVARGANALSNAGKAVGKVVPTKAGEIVQKVAPKAAEIGMRSPSIHDPFKFAANATAGSPTKPDATQISGNLYNATDDSLRNVAGQLQQEPALKFMGESLSKALESGDNGEKNRAIFLIMQNPKSRRLVSPEGK